jgi:hypothetical protein
MMQTANARQIPPAQSSELQLQLEDRLASHFRSAAGHHQARSAAVAVFIELSGRGSTSGSRTVLLCTWS